MKLGGLIEITSLFSALSFFFFSPFPSYVQPPDLSRGGQGRGRKEGLCCLNKHLSGETRNSCLGFCVCVCVSAKLRRNKDHRSLLSCQQSGYRCRLFLLHLSTGRVLCLFQSGFIQRQMSDFVNSCLQLRFKGAVHNINLMRLLCTAIVESDITTPPVCVVLALLVYWITRPC